MPPRPAVGPGLIAGLILGPFLALLDLSIVTVALPDIGTQLHTDAAGQQWVVDGYGVSIAALLLSGGTLGDRVGRRRTYVLGLVVFTLSSAACAAAPGIGTLIAARVVQGGGAALLMTGSLSLLVQAFPDPRARAIQAGRNGMIGGLSIVLGPVLGGLLVDGAGWRWIFVVNLPIGVVAIWLVRRAMPESSDREHAALDPLGQVLGFVLLAAVTFGLIESRDHGWTSATTLAPMIIAVGSLASFVAVERRVTRPMLPMSLFARRSFTVPGIASFVLGFGTSGLFILFSLYLQQVQGRSPLAVGMLFLPLSAAIVLVAPFASRIVGRTGPLPVMVGGYLICVLGLFGVLVLDVHSSALLVSGFGVVLGIGMGSSIGSTQLAGVLALPRERSGLAAASVTTARQSGTAIGVAVLGLIISTAAGTPGAPSYAEGFVRGMHVAGVVAAIATLATVLLIAWCVRRDRRVSPVPAEPAALSNAR